MILALLTGNSDRIAEIAALSSLDVVPIDLRGSPGAVAITTVAGATELLLALAETAPRAPFVLVGPSVVLTDAEARFVRHAIEARVTVLALSRGLEVWRVTGLGRDHGARAVLELDPVLEPVTIGVH
jgi:hypothetical protein